MSMERTSRWQGSTMEIALEEAPQAAPERGKVTGYWKNDNSGSQTVEPFFYLASPGEVTVQTSSQGQLNVSLNFFNQTTNQGGPSLPQTGGITHLGPGQWRIYFLGSISNGRIDVTVTFP
jgi:hypothetical protein